MNFLRSKLDLKNDEESPRKSKQGSTMYPARTIGKQKIDTRNRGSAATSTVAKKFWGGDDWEHVRLLSKGPCVGLSESAQKLFT